ncbi:uncharacterized protein LOC106636723 [Copidosoma floridanum]|uniref:uncharacterized protein LOC106636723 n=1 Tax=Copidosoma floridanum TaxID=29053 RepID=UPI0006C970D3|nr:uncharacterized protein LOC106636723 [Copidosoma floridanum]
MRFITWLLAAHPDPQANSTAALTTVSHTQRGKLLEIKLPHFSGNYTEWVSFRDLFSIIMEDERLTDLERLYYLRALLSGQPAKLIEGLPLTAESFKLAWDALLERYENKLFVLAQLLQAKSRIPPLRVLDALFVDELLRALDRPTKKAWETSPPARADFPTFEALEEFLIERAQALEMVDAQSTKRQDNSSTSSNTHPRVNIKSNSTRITSSNQKSSHSSILLPTAVAQVRAPAAHYHLRLLIDQGSELSYISEDAVKRLQLTRTKSNICILGIGGNVVSKALGKVEIRLFSLYSDSSVDVVLHVLPRVTAPLPSFQCKTRSWLHMEFLELADPHFYLPQDIDLLLGTDFYSAIITSDLLRGSLSEPIAQRTLFGWIFSGCVNQPVTKINRHTHHFVSKIEDKLQELLINFWIQEEVPSKSSSQLTPEEQKCEVNFVRTHSRDSTGRCVVKLPLKQSPFLLGNSVNHARKCFDRTLARLKTDDKYDKLYTDFMNEYLSLGHMRPVPADELNIKPHFYLPYHGVLKEDGDNAKLRVVFNGSALTFSGHSLNSITHTGPNLLPNITDILFWLRTFKWTFSADISKMYRQIKVHPDDWDLQRIIWHSKTHEEAHFQLTTVTYGTRPAPFLATRSLLQLVKDGGHRYPQAARILTSGRYVDDIFGGAETPNELNEQALQLKELCMAGGFHLAKWHSNSPGFSYSNSSEESALSLDDCDAKVLGMVWKPLSENLTFQCTLKPLSQTPTKRTILSEISQIFDPLGIVAPVIIAAKLIIQELWLLKITWDTPIPDALAQRWLHIRDDLAKLSGVTVPRWLGAHPPSAVELHGFADASQDAMGAVIYLVIKSDSATSSSFVCSKTKVSPLKRISIPRLELTAALILAKLTKLWWHGPEWMIQPQDGWPLQPSDVEVEDETEARQVSALVSSVSDSEFLLRLTQSSSTLHKLYRITATLLLACAKFKALLTHQESSVAVTAELITQAKLLLIRLTQQECFKEEIKMLKSGYLPKGRVFHRLMAYTDDAGKLRVEDRLVNAKLRPDAKHPALLPRQAQFTSLVIDQAHRQTLHGELSSLLAKLIKSFG